MLVLKFHYFFLLYLLAHNQKYQTFACLMLYFLYVCSFLLKKPLYRLSAEKSKHYVPLPFSHFFQLQMFPLHCPIICILYLYILFHHLLFHMHAPKKKYLLHSPATQRRLCPPPTGSCRHSCQQDSVLGRNQNRKVPLPHQTWPPNNRMARGRYSWTH